MDSEVFFTVKEPGVWGIFTDKQLSIKPGVVYLAKIERLNTKNPNIRILSNAEALVITKGHTNKIYDLRGL